MKSFSRLGVIFVLIGLAIFGNGEACNAECGWVLWTKIGSIDKGRWDPGQWQIYLAFPAYDLCIQSHIKNFNRSKDTFSKSNTPISTFDDDSGFWVFDSTEPRKTVFSYESKCLPDTVDPRK